MQNETMKEIRKELRLAQIERTEIQGRLVAHDLERDNFDETALANAMALTQEATNKLTEALTAQALGQQPKNIASLRTAVEKHSKHAAEIRETLDNAKREHAITATTLQAMAGAVDARIGAITDRLRNEVIPVLRNGVAGYLKRYEDDARQAAKSYCEVLGLIRVITNITGSDPGLYGPRSMHISLPGFAGQPYEYLTRKDISAYQEDLRVALGELTEGMEGTVAPRNPQQHDTEHGLHLQAMRRVLQRHG